MNPEYAWFDVGEGRQVYRRVPDETPHARSHLPCPHVVSDQVEVRSMVDGKVYTSKRALRQSYRAKGYIEVGDQEQKAPPKTKVDRKAVRASVERAFSKAGLGA